MRERERVPLPHVTVHTLHSVHVLTAQSTGHVSVLQADTSSRALHGLPPLAGARLTLRKRLRLPPPHVRLQDANTP